MSPRDARREGPFAIHVDGEKAFGFVKSVSGGAARTNVAIRTSRRMNTLRKLPISRSYDALQVDAGMGAPSGLFRWISETLERGFVTRSGEVHACDVEGKSLGVNQFFDAQIGEITFPRLDSRSSEDAFVSVKINPRGVRHRAGTGKEIVAKSPAPGRKIRQSSFRVEIADLPCDTIRQVEEIKWNLAPAEQSFGAGRFPVGDPIEWTDIGNLQFRLSFLNQQDWIDWAEDFQAGDTAANEVNGFVEWLSADGTVALGRVELEGCGLIAINPLAMQAAQASAPEFEVELYINNLGFSLL